MPLDGGRSVQPRRDARGSRARRARSDRDPDGQRGCRRRTRRRRAPAPKTARARTRSSPHRRPCPVGRGARCATKEQLDERTAGQNATRWCLIPRMSTQDGGPSAGWYADPENSQRERWWDGEEWSAKVRPVTTADSVASSPVGVVQTTSGLAIASLVLGIIGLCGVGAIVAHHPRRRRVVADQEERGPRRRSRNGDRGHRDGLAVGGPRDRRRGRLDGGRRQLGGHRY